MNVRKHVSLANYSTIGLGGKALTLTELDKNSDLLDAVLHLQNQNAQAPIWALGQGSNVLFAGGTINIHVLCLRETGIRVLQETEAVCLRVQAGHPWDELVCYSIARGLSSLVFLSGIPGTVGAAPIQNIGAYGSELSSVIDAVHCFDVHSKKHCTFSSAQCQFDYRSSFFKRHNLHRRRYIIIAIDLRMFVDQAPLFNYQQLNEKIPLTIKQSCQRWSQLTCMQKVNALNKIRAVVMELRRQKSMLINADDLHSRSLGSFFMNPILSKSDYMRLRKRSQSKIPVFPHNGHYKISAAWLIEQSGYYRGRRVGKVGISAKHALALVNYGGSANELNALAIAIEKTVYEKFAIRLKREIETVGFS